MQIKTKIISYFVLGGFLTSTFFSFSSLALAQNIDESVYESCPACTLTPDALVRYTQFVRSVLDSMSSASRIDYKKVSTGGDVTKGTANILVDYVKQENDSYFGVFKREGRVVAGEIQGATREATQAVIRDAFGNFTRESVAGLRSSAITRDIAKLEQLDESIDREAIIHMSNFVFRDPIPSDQITKLISTFGAYNDIFVIQDSKYSSSPFDAGLTYKDIIGWLNLTQRKMKNHITFYPKKDFKLESSKGIHYNLNTNRSKELSTSYNCIKAAGGLNCNPTYGKTSGLMKEFSQNVSSKVTNTLKKFESSFKKLKNLSFKNYFKGFGSNYGLQISQSSIESVKNVAQGTKVLGQGLYAAGKGVDTILVNMQQDIAQEKEWKQEIKKAYDECKAGSEDWQKVSYRQPIFGPFGVTKQVGCLSLVNENYEGLELVNLSAAEIARIKLMKDNMDNLITNTLLHQEEDGDLFALSSPTTVSKQFPILSKTIYSTKGMVHDLIAQSIEGCLAFCKNLNSKVNCGSK